MSPHYFEKFSSISRLGHSHLQLKKFSIAWNWVYLFTDDKLFTVAPLRTCKFTQYTIIRATDNHDTWCVSCLPCMHPTYRKYTMVSLSCSIKTYKLLNLGLKLLQDLTRVITKWKVNVFLRHGVYYCKLEQTHHICNSIVKQINTQAWTKTKHPNRNATKNFKNTKN